ncbi:MAG: DegQ family serine endoprotease [Steroidobacteraceae bacterium]
MKLVVCSWLACGMAATATAQSVNLPAAVGETPMPSLAPMIKRVSPAVVNIATRGTVRQRAPRNPLLDDPFFRRFFDIPEMGPRERQFQSAGSGVIFDARKGHIVTNAHVIESASEITVTLMDGRDLKATVVGSDEASDIAVLKVEPSTLTQIALGDSDRVEVGDFVVAIGNPFGLQHTVTSGIVSGLGRSGINPQGYEDFIQTDASINPGNSGGALVNLRGELIAINSAILSRSGGNIGIGFAIPVNMARSVIDQLIQYGEVRRGLLGINIYSLTPDLAKSLGLASTQGVLVSQVAESSAADQAGIRPGDVITAINNKPVRTSTDLRNAIGLLRVGERIDVAVLRDGRPRRLTALIPDPDPPTATPGNGARPPTGTDAIHPQLDGALLVDAPEGGVLVRSIEPRSPAALAQLLRAGDRIEAANRQRVVNLAELRKIARGGGPLVLTVRRGNAMVLIPLRTP